MDQEAAAVAAHVRQYGAIHTHGAKEIVSKMRCAGSSVQASVRPKRSNRRCSRERRCDPFVL
jgi:hypothetical protein